MPRPDPRARLVFNTDPSNDMLVGPGGCHYDTEAEIMYFDHLGLCGCGNPADVHKFLVDACETFDRDTHGYKGDGPIEKITGLVQENPEIVAEFVAHFLDQRNFLDHGSSVYGSWLSDLGKQFIEIGPHIDRDEP